MSRRNDWARSQYYEYNNITLYSSSFVETGVDGYGEKNVKRYTFSETEMETEK